MNKIIDLGQWYEALKMTTQEAGEVEKTPFPYSAIRGEISSGS